MAYDNRGDHLSLSPLLMESFLKLGQSIIESPDFDPKNVGIWKTFLLPPADGCRSNRPKSAEPPRGLSDPGLSPTGRGRLARSLCRLMLSRRLDAGVDSPTR